MSPEDEPTCGKGLAEHSAIPNKFGEILVATADILELHTEALDMSVERSRTEHAAYMEVATAYRTIGAQLLDIAARMRRCRDLPMGSHDEHAMSRPEHAEAFGKFVVLEREFFQLLGHRLDEDEEMLVAMGGSLNQ